MLFSSIVFMNRTLRGQWITAVVFVFVLNLNISSSGQIQHDNVMKFSGDFEDFLEDLGTLVYKKNVNGNDLRSGYKAYTTPPNKIRRRNQNEYNTQKAALGDVLMMKLVSYYEDKYKLTHLEPTTTERITLMQTYPNNINKYNYDTVDPIFEKYQYHHLPQEQQRQLLQPVRRMEETKVEDDIPEVVIL